MILVTGGTGMLGKSLSKYVDGIFLGSSDYDLTQFEQVNECFKKYKPRIVVHLAAKVGGIINNNNHQYDFYIENTRINTNVIDACVNNSIDKIIAISSTCVYPSNLKHYPATEEVVNEGMPEKTNLSYAYSKRMMKVQLDAAYNQYGLLSSIIYCSNMYGPHDCFDVEKCHLIPALINKIYISKKSDDNSVELYGTGNPLRQITYVDDVAKIINQFIKNKYYGDFNVSIDENMSVREIAHIVADVIGFKGNINFNGRLDGQYRKDVSCKKLYKLIDKFEFTSLHKGVEKTYQWYKDNILCGS